MKTPATETAEHPNPNRWWRHRRRGYYTGLAWAILQTPAWVTLEVLKPGTISALAVVIGWSYGISATLIISYFGNTTAEALASRGKP